MSRPFTPIAGWTGTNNTNDAYYPVTSCTYEGGQSNVESGSLTQQFVAGTYKGLQIKIQTSGSTTASVHFRINGSNGNQSITIPSSTTGVFNDTTNTDTVLPGDVCTIFVNKSGTMNILGTSVQFQCDDKRYMISKYAFYVPSGIIYNVSGVTRYLGIMGSQVSTTATESNATHMQTDTDFIAKNLQVLIFSNSGASGACTIRFRNGTTNGNMFITIPSLATGTFSMASDVEDYVVAGTRPGYSVTTGGAAISIRPAMIGIDCYATASVGEGMIWAKDDVQFNSTAAIRSPILGALSFINNANTSRTTFRCDGRLDLFRLYVSVNTKSTDTTVSLQKNGANTGIVITIPAGVIGEFSNLTDVDYFVDGDTYNYLVTTLSAQNLTLVWSSIRVKYNQGNKPIGGWF